MGKDIDNKLIPWAALIGLLLSLFIISPWGQAYYEFMKGIWWILAIPVLLVAWYIGERW